MLSYSFIFQPERLEAVDFGLVEYSQVEAGLGGRLTRATCNVQQLVRIETVLSILAVGFLQYIYPSATSADLTGSALTLAILSRVVPRRRKSVSNERKQKGTTICYSK